ncbi:hypothetical protein SAMN05444004_103270 [Jannaschia faecimaris]|uniref:Protease inhibitor Inh n=1 Tax=Jannaschia faecimaris TaxID=1244108 RepID=A0A1H3N4X9_9RHOB|nr:hypothetical protein [Jannaschia faecimaris]SDY83793.1 hypothetical protein SAMN05444004_103270 [Jannaschia faecimaris]
MPVIRALALVFCATNVAAQETPVSPDVFLDLAENQTVTFMLDRTDLLVGEERFINRERSVWTRSDGSCAMGDITVRGAKLCFVYDDDPGTNHCWLPFEETGELFVRSTVNGQVQRIAGMEKRRLECLGEPLS